MEIHMVYLEQAPHSLWFAKKYDRLSGQLLHNEKSLALKLFGDGLCSGE